MRTDFCVLAIRNESMVKITLTGPSTAGWLGIGIGTRMADSDMMIAWKNEVDGTFVVSDRTGTGRVMPTADSINALQLVPSECSDSDGKWTIVFQRPITGVSPNRDFPVSTANFIWALGTSNPRSSNPSAAISGHGQVYGSFSANLFTSDASTIDIIYALHGLLMFMAWGVCAPFGVWVARYLKKMLGVWWFRLHWSLLGVVVGGCTYVGFGLAYTKNTTSERFTNPHAVSSLFMMNSSSRQISNRIFILCFL
jgi:hypothetical protein